MQKLDKAFQEALSQQGLPSALLESLETLYKPIAARLALVRNQRKSPVLIGINGAQGSGKSTFCSLLTPVLQHEHHMRVAVLSIDDVYHSHAKRQIMGREVHPLCAIRGVPGTHDINLAQETLNGLLSLREGQTMRIPRFDKARDDRKPREDWEVIEGPIDLVLFEGWCVACPDLPPWTGPYNNRERRDDPDGLWARWSAESLSKDYRQLFDQIDTLIMIQIPSMDVVRQSRWLQEQKLWEKQKTFGDEPSQLVGLMTQSEVMDYVDLFERYTEHMLKELPGAAPILIKRDPDFRYTLKRL